MSGTAYIISNRLPITANKDENGQWQFKPSSGGLVTALNGLKSLEVEKEDQEAVFKELYQKHRAIPVFLDKEIADLHYNGFSNSILWPLFHYLPGEANFSEIMWQAYYQANLAFGKVVEDIEIGEDDILWIHDYHLMLLPRILRFHFGISRSKIGFFLHTPFPSSEVFRVLPVRKEILQGLLSCNLIGFHNFDYVRHFTSACSMLPLKVLPNGIEYEGNYVKIDAFPIGIEPKVFEKACRAEAVLGRVEELKSIYKGKKVILGVDRLDYIKGLCQKLEGFRRFLEKYNEHRDDTVLIQVAVPSREEVQEYVDLRSLVFETVGAINGKYGSSDHTPISLINQSVNMTELCALYKIADACVVSSTRDGMNLVSYEYVACQQESHGVLILSEFAGAAQSLNGALIVNPWNLEELADSFQEALLMDPEFKKESHSRLIKYVKKHTASFWGCNFIAELEATEPHRQSQSLAHSWELVLRQCKGKELIAVIDYDYLQDKINYSNGHLSKALIEQLSSTHSPSLIIFTKQDEEAILHNPWGYHVGYIVEQGCSFREPKSNRWECIFETKDKSWKELACPIFRFFQERTPGASVLKYKNSWLWTFAYGDPEFWNLQAEELRSSLMKALSQHQVQITLTAGCLAALPAAYDLKTSLSNILMSIAKKPNSQVICLTARKTASNFPECLSSACHTLDIPYQEIHIEAENASMERIVNMFDSISIE